MRAISGEGKVKIRGEDEQGVTGALGRTDLSAKRLSTRARFWRVDGQPSWTHSLRARERRSELAVEPSSCSPRLDGRGGSLKGEEA